MNHDEIMVQRRGVVDVARTWIGTPYHDNAKLKGVGTDCLNFMVASVEEYGLIPVVKVPHYYRGQNMHRTEETYINGLLQYMDEVSGPPEREPLPADIILWKFGRIYFHGALILAWPMVLHVYGITGRVQEEDLRTCNYLNTVGENGPDQGKPRARKFFRFRHWIEQ